MVQKPAVHHSSRNDSPTIHLWHNTLNETHFSLSFFIQQKSEALMQLYHFEWRKQLSASLLFEPASCKSDHRPKWPHLTKMFSSWRPKQVLTRIEVQEHTDIKKTLNQAQMHLCQQMGLWLCWGGVYHAVRPIFTKSTLINISELQTRLNLLSANCNLPSLNWPTIEPTW